MAGFSLLAALGGEEGRFLTPLLAAPYDRGGLAAYRAYLEGIGDPRGEVLAVQDALLAGAAPDAAAALMARLDELVAGCDETWWKIVERLAHVRNCGAAAALPAVVRFKFACPNRWESLAPTSRPAVRWCGDCRHDVYRCETLADAEARARAGDCISVPAALAGAAGSEATRSMTGRPDPVEHWGRRIFPDAE